MMTDNTGVSNMRNLTLNESMWNTSSRTVMLIETYSMPVICIFGLLGNSLAFLTFLQKPLRQTASSHYLMARSLSDNGFLVALSIIWISRTFHLGLSSVHGVCQLAVFLTYVCGSVSVWLVVFITAENFLLIWHPFSVRTFCATKPSVIIVAILCVASLALYQFPLWISNADCSHNPVYHKLTQGIVYTDTVLTFIVPSVIMSILMTAICYKVIQGIHRERQKKKIMNTLPNLRKISNNIPLTRVTRMLTAVSLVFFVLNMPSHMIRLRFLITGFTQRAQTVSEAEADAQTICLLLYYSNFAINIVIYLGLGSNFRKTFRDTLQICRRSHSARNNFEAVNLVPKIRRRSLPAILELDDDDSFLSVPKPNRSNTH